MFDIEQYLLSGPISPEVIRRLDRLRPHLARAGLMAARLQLERASGAVAALEAIGIPAAVIGASTQVLAANQGLLALSPGITIGAFNRLNMKSPILQTLLVKSLEEKAHSDRFSGSIAIPATPEEPAVIIHVIPVRRGGSDLFIGASTLLVATPVTAGPAPSAEILDVLFDLTPAEARLARSLADGKTVTEVASRNGNAVGTVRTQLKAVMAKTGVSRQQDLIRLLSQIQPLHKNA